MPLIWAERCHFFHTTIWKLVLAAHVIKQGSPPLPAESLHRLAKGILRLKLIWPPPHCIASCTASIPVTQELKQPLSISVKPFPLLQCQFSCFWDRSSLTLFYNCIQSMYTGTNRPSNYEYYMVEFSFRVWCESSEKHWREQAVSLYSFAVVKVKCHEKVQLTLWQHSDATPTLLQCQAQRLPMSQVL